MFVNAIAQINRFTRPIMFISRKYQSQNVLPGLATMFFVNGQGCAITCKHVAQQFLQCEPVTKKYAEFREAAARAKERKPDNYKKEIRKLEKEYGYRSGVTVNMKAHFVNAPTPIKGIAIHMHPEYDLAVFRFDGFEKLNYPADNIYLLDNEEEIRQGKSLCRLGFPFPEFTNYRYDGEMDDILWTSEPPQVPSFPLDGIVTRHIGSRERGIFGIEMSTPGLRGQSGGPLFDDAGRIYGMQFATHHLHLGFDMENMPMMINGEQKNVNNQPFLHVGQCLHISVIKDFLRQHDIPFKTA